MTIDTALFFTAFLTGLLGSTHCIGMCGGMVSMLAWQPETGARVPQGTVIPIQAVPTALTCAALLRQLAFNSGRITSYTVAGGVVGGMAALSLVGQTFFPLRQSLHIAAQVLMILLGLTILGKTAALAWVERGGAVLWRRIQPFTKTLLPAKTAPQAFALGTLWGWLPCGMVYSMLLTALASGGAVQGAAVMLAFGLGTLPMLMAMGSVAAQSRARLQSAWFRYAAGLIIIGFGVVGLLRIPELARLPGLATLCRAMGIQ